MKYSQIYKQTVSDGVGIRVSLYVSGCRNHCPGCHNPESQDFEYGKEFTLATMNEVISALTPSYITGLTLCGGEPMELENQKELKNLAKLVKAHLPKKTIWCYTGYEFSDLRPGGKRYAEDTDDLLNNLDVLVIGPFIQDKRDITKNNKWRGSTNQRVINVPDSLKVGKPIPVIGIPNNDIN